MFLSSVPSSAIDKPSIVFIDLKVDGAFNPGFGCADV